MILTCEFFPNLKCQKTIFPNNVFTQNANQIIALRYLTSLTAA